MIDEIVAFDKRITSLGALVPFAGPWLISRSEVHSPREKSRLQWISVALTTVVVVAMLALFPYLRSRSVGTRDRIESEMEVLDGIAEDFRAAHGGYPDAGTWQRTAELPDRRFFDPWGRPYRYRPSDTGVTIATLGRDGLEGGTGEDTDISKTFPGADSSH